MSDPSQQQQQPSEAIQLPTTPSENSNTITVTTTAQPQTNIADANSLEFNIRIHDEGDSDDDGVHHRRHLYKGRGEQIERREKFLKLQKEKKRDLTNHARNLALPSKEEPQSPQSPSKVVEEEEGGGEEEELTIKDESMSEASTKAIPTTTTTTTREKEMKKKKEPKEKKTFLDQLMIPEPLKDMPTDNNEWVAVPSPPGQRCLVISSRKSTQVRLSNGKLIKSFYSLLPNGSKYHRSKLGDYCILDCIFYEPSFTFFVLDMMCWKGYSLYDCTTEFRFYWKTTKLQEIPDLAQKTEDNPYKFIPLPFHDCTIEGLGSIQTSTASLGFERAAVVWYNKNTQYTLGFTPLVCVITREQELSFLEALAKGEMSMN